MHALSVVMRLPLLWVVPCDERTRSDLPEAAQEPRGAESGLAAPLLPATAAEARGGGVIQ